MRVIIILGICFGLALSFISCGAVNIEFRPSAFFIGVNIIDKISSASLEDGEVFNQTVFQTSHDFPITLTITNFALEDLDFVAGLMPLDWTYVHFGKPQEVVLFTLVQHGANPSFSYNWRVMPGGIRAQHNDSHIYELPYESGQSRKIIQGYNGLFSHSGEYALDFAMPEGTKVLAARAGKVVDTQGNYTEGGAKKVYKDNFVQILHDDGTLASYAHLQYKGVAVNIYDQVKTGQLIGYSGNTGFSSTPHLHFFVFKNLTAYKKQSIPTKFRTRQGILKELKQGKTYSK